jgi:hypothetical protein
LPAFDFAASHKEASKIGRQISATFDPNMEREMLWCSIYGTFRFLTPFALEGAPPDISALLGE